MDKVQAITDWGKGVRGLSCSSLACSDWAFTVSGSQQPVDDESEDYGFTVVAGVLALSCRWCCSIRHLMVGPADRVRGT